MTPPPRPAGDGEPPADVDWSGQGIETELGWSLQATYTGFSRTAITAVAGVPGGPRGYQVLVAITTEPAVSQLALARRLGIDKTPMTYVIDALEGDGLVERRPDPRDRRVRRVVATPQGEALLAATRTALREVEAALLRDLSPPEQTQLRQLLARVALGADRAPSCLVEQATGPVPDDPTTADTAPPPPSPSGRGRRT